MNRLKYSINIEIAGFKIKLRSDSKIEPDEGYIHFLSSNFNGNPDLIIKCFNEPLTGTFENEKPVFEAQNEKQRFYSVYRLNKKFRFVIYDQHEAGEIQQIAFADESFTNWEIHCQPTNNNKIFPLKYPMGPVLMHYLTLKSEAILMHASCVYDGKQARLFSGFSGAGKSTISRIWSEAGNLIINDDRLIIRKIDNQYFAHNTPMYYKDVPKKAPLNSIYLISHSKENNLKKLTGAKAVSKVMAFCIQNNFDRQFIDSRLDFISEMCLRIPVYELGFVPDASVINFILDNEKDGSK